MVAYGKNNKCLTELKPVIELLSITRINNTFNIIIILCKKSWKLKGNNFHVRTLQPLSDTKGQSEHIRALNEEVYNLYIRTFFIATGMGYQVSPAIKTSTYSSFKYSQSHDLSISLSHTADMQGVA